MMTPFDLPTPHISPRIEPMEDGGSPVIVWLVGSVVAILIVAAIYGALLVLPS